MKILFDQNISHRVVGRLSNIFLESKHVRDFNLPYSTDREIWNFAKANNFSIITFDSDFYDFVTLYGHPPKVIWLRFGNTFTQNLAERIEDKKEFIKSFLEDIEFKEIAVLEIDD